MKAKRKPRTNRVASDDVLYEYIVELMNDSSREKRKVIIRARTAKDAITFADFNECRATDYRGAKIESVWSIRAV